MASTAIISIKNPCSEVPSGRDICNNGAWRDCIHDRVRYVVESAISVTGIA